jgi:hypothetical protein
MIERPHGQGRVIIAASSATPAWSSLPLQPCFVPLMQRLVAHLATPTATTRSIPLGQPLQLSFAQPPTASGKRSSPSPSARLTGQEGDRYTLHTPTDGSLELRLSLQAQQTLQLRSPPTTSPGVYTLSRTGDTATHPLKFAVNVNPKESDPRTLTPAETQRLAQRFGAHYADSLPSYQAQDRQRRYGSEAWPLLLFLLLALLFAEVILSQRIAR